VNKDKKKRTSSIVSDATPINYSPPSTPSASASSSLAGTKRKTNDSSDLVLETLQRLEQQQREQREIINVLLTQQTVAIRQVPQAMPVDFETAFNTFLAAYSNLPVEDRPNKVRKVLCGAPEQAENLSEFILLAASSEPLVDNSKE